MDGTTFGSEAGAALDGLNEVGTNSLAVARIIPIGFVSTLKAAELGSGAGSGARALPPDWKPGGTTPPLEPEL